MSDAKLKIIRCDVPDALCLGGPMFAARWHLRHLRLRPNGVVVLCVGQGARIILYAGGLKAQLAQVVYRALAEDDALFTFVLAEWPHEPGAGGKGALWFGMAA
ncbi:MAG: hypothetical protein ACJAVR_003857 [Paracoccaceae bacterium]